MGDNNTVSLYENIIQILLVTIPVITAIIGIATAYLRLYIKNEFRLFDKELKQELSVDEKYISRETLEEKFKEIDRRLERLE